MSFTVTSIMVTDVGDSSCWWQVTKTKLSPFIALLTSSKCMHLRLQCYLSASYRSLVNLLQNFSNSFLLKTIKLRWIINDIEAKLLFYKTKGRNKSVFVVFSFFLSIKIINFWAITILINNKRPVLSMDRYKMENYTFEPDSERNSREGKIGCKIRACTFEIGLSTTLCWWAQ